MRKFSTKQAILTISIVVAIVIVMVAAAFIIPRFSLKKTSIATFEPTDKTEVGEPVGIDSGEIEIAKSGSKTMLMDTKTLNIKLIDNATKQEWNTINPNGGDLEKSLIVANFLGKDSKSYQWNSYKYSVANKTYEINRINNGVQIVMNMVELDSIRLDEYMPKRMSIERYEELFLSKLDSLVVDGTIDETAAKKYKTTLGLIYQKDKNTQTYYNKFVGSPPLNAVVQLIEFSKLIGYTREMLILDNEEYEIVVSFKENPDFTVTLEVKLDNDDLVVNIPTYEIGNKNDFYTMQNIQVLPQFGSMTADEVTDGYILAPDGAGALFKLNDFKGGYSDYTRPYYNNNYYNNVVYEIPVFSQDLNMPIFGMTYEKSEAAGGDKGGFLGIIESGDNTAFLDVRIANPKGGSSYNKVYTSVDVTQYSRVKVFGPYSTDETRYLTTTGLIPMDYTVRYKLFSDKVDYYDLAVHYKKYLAEKNGVQPNYNFKPKMYLDFVGTLEIEQRFVGVPYRSGVAMTTLGQVQDIIGDLGINDLIVNYSGAFDGGKNNKLLKSSKITSTSGGASEYKKLKEFTTQNGIDLFLETNFTKVHDSGNMFVPKQHAIFSYSGRYLNVYNYNVKTGRFSGQHDGYNFVAPEYLTDVVNKFIKNSDADLLVDDMGHEFYANYKPRNMVLATDADRIISDNLETISDGRTLAISNPNANKALYGKYATDISRESSDYGMIYSTVPFRQLVLNGLVEYTSTNANMSSEGYNYYLLQALELGSHIKFTLTAENTEILKNTEFTGLFSTKYDTLKDNIQSLYNEYSEVFRSIGAVNIINHRILSDNVFETTYESGVKIITNYNRFDVDIDGKLISALGYLVA